ncbi:hypothetical protein BC830DRAFT_1128778 [Chytriomyces sp. MP71]|nr:hypothetical protein BC830DRAFT_1128778 [Chytriomyces sp. MP71]
MRIPCVASSLSMLMLFHLELASVLISQPLEIVDSKLWVAKQNAVPPLRIVIPISSCAYTQTIFTRILLQNLSLTTLVVCHLLASFVKTAMAILLQRDVIVYIKAPGQSLGRKTFHLTNTPFPLQTLVNVNSCVRCRHYECVEPVLPTPPVSPANVVNLEF